MAQCMIYIKGFSTKTYWVGLGFCVTEGAGDTGCVGVGFAD